MVFILFRRIVVINYKVLLQIKNAFDKQKINIY